MTPFGLLSGPALACGGLFCSTAAPVDQAGEEILFAVDRAAGTVTMHVEITYEGPSNEFSWVLPVPAEPELAIGTDALFPVLAALRAQWNFSVEMRGCGMNASPAADSAGNAAGGDGGVSVVSRGAVGPFDTVVLQANASDALVEWLVDNGYDLPTAIEAALTPYVAADQYFVALKLLKDKDAGDIEPLALTWAGEHMSIPIQLTAVAATPDMRLRVYVLGDHRAVPESYLHVHLNHLSIDWWTRGSNLEDIVTAAADEAGGHAFFTDYAGPTDPITGQLHQAAWDQVDLTDATDALDLLERIVDARLPLDDPMLGVLSHHLDLPAEEGPGLDLRDVLACMAPATSYGYTYEPYGPCYEDDLVGIAIDGAAVAADVEAVVLEPRRRTEALLTGAAKISRMTSSVSPVEMTLDPSFVFNPDMPDVALNRFGTEVVNCTGDAFDTAPRRLELEDGRKVGLPSQAKLGELGMTSYQWLESQGLTQPYNAIIERTGASGSPEILVDNRGRLQDDADASLEGIEGTGACGCRTGAAASGWLLLLPLLLARRRR